MNKDESDDYFFSICNAKCRPAALCLESDYWSVWHWKGGRASLCRHLQFGRNIHEETLDRLPDRCERYVALHSLPGVTCGYVCHFVVSRRERKRETGYCRFRHSYREVRVQQWCSRRYGPAVLWQMQLHFFRRHDFGDTSEVGCMGHKTKRFVCWSGKWC